MSTRFAATNVLVISILGGVLGCQPLARVHYRAGAPVPRVPHPRYCEGGGRIAGARITAARARVLSRTDANARILSRTASPVILAADFADPPATSPAPVNDSARTTDEKKPSEEKKSDTAAQPAPGYTAPSEAIRQLILITAVATTSGSSTGNGTVGKEFAESSTGLSGAPGLSAPTVSISTGVIGPPGLQEGVASALGPISANSLFQPARNTLAGVNGGCAALARGGFFQGSETGCRSFFRPEARIRSAHGTSKFARK